MVGRLPLSTVYCFIVLQYYSTISSLGCPVLSLADKGGHRTEEVIEKGEQEKAQLDKGLAFPVRHLTKHVCGLKIDAPLSQPMDMIQDQWHIDQEWNDCKCH